MFFLQNEGIFGCLTPFTRHHLYIYYQNSRTKPVFRASWIPESQMKVSHLYSDLQCQSMQESLLYAFFWIIPQCLKSDTRELPRRKHATFRAWQKFEIKKESLLLRLLLFWSLLLSLLLFWTLLFKTSVILIFIV